MQFALHYMGQSEARMRRFMHEVSRHLRVGGVFIATTMDSRVLIQLLMRQAEQSWVSGHVVLRLYSGQRRTLCKWNFAAEHELDVPGKRSVSTYLGAICSVLVIILKYVIIRGMCRVSCWR